MYRISLSLLKHHVQSHRLFFLLFFYVLVLSLYLSISLNQIKNSTRLNYLSTGVESEHRSLHSPPYQRAKSNVNFTEKTPRQGTKTSRRPNRRSIVRDSRKSSISSKTQKKHQPKPAQFSHHITIFINLKNSFLLSIFQYYIVFFIERKTDCKSIFVIAIRFDSIRLDSI